MDDVTLRFLFTKAKGCSPNHNSVHVHKARSIKNVLLRLVRKNTSGQNKALILAPKDQVFSSVYDSWVSIYFWPNCVSFYLPFKCVIWLLVMTLQNLLLSQLKQVWLSSKTIWNLVILHIILVKDNR